MIHPALTVSNFNFIGLKRVNLCLLSRSYVNFHQTFCRVKTIIFLQVYCDPPPPTIKKLKYVEGIYQWLYEWKGMLKIPPHMLRRNSIISPYLPIFLSGYDVCSTQDYFYKFMKAYSMNPDQTDSRKQSDLDLYCLQC